MLYIDFNTDISHHSSWDRKKPSSWPFLVVSSVWQLTGATCGLFFLEVWNPFKSSFFWWLCVGGGRKKRFVFAVIAEKFACLGIFQEVPQIFWSGWFGNHGKILSVHSRRSVNPKKSCHKWVVQSYVFVQGLGRLFLSPGYFSSLFTTISCRIWTQITSEQDSVQDTNMTSLPGTSVQGLHALALSDPMLRTFPPWINQCQQSEPRAHL